MFIDVLIRGNLIHFIQQWKRSSKARLSKITLYIEFLEGFQFQINLLELCFCLGIISIYYCLIVKMISWTEHVVSRTISVYVFFFLILKVHFISSACKMFQYSQLERCTHSIQWNIVMVAMHPAILIITHLRNTQQYRIFMELCRKSVKITYEWLPMLC